MELNYDLLWRACTWFLLCFLVTRLVSLVLITPPQNPYDSVSGSVKDSRFKRTVADYYAYNDDGDHQKKKKKKKKSVLDNDANKRGCAVGDRLKFHDAKKSLTHRVECDDKVVEFVKDIQVDSSGGKVNLVENDYHHDDLGNVLVKNEGMNQGFEMDKVESDEFGKELIDQIVEEKDLFSGVVDDDGKVGGKLERGLDIIADFGSNKIVDSERNVVNQDCVPFGEGGEEHVLNEEGLGGGNGVDVEQTLEVSSSSVDTKEEARIVGRDVTIVDHTEEGVVGFWNKEEPRADSGLAGGRIEDGGDPIVEERTSNVYGEGVLSDDEEWEGIERSEIDKQFAIAVDFVKREEVEGRLAKVGSELMMQLCALQKIAMEGPCHEPQPMAIMLSARARWNAWQKLGSMSPEEAMEQYIILLSDIIPGWKEAQSPRSA